MTPRRRAAAKSAALAAGAETADGTRRSEILEAASALIASSGLRTSLQEIADAAGILPGSLYHHFESKEALIVELVDRYLAELDEIAAQARDDLQSGDGKSHFDRIASLADAISRCAIRNRAALLQTFYDPPVGASEELVRLAKQTPAAVDQAIDSGSTVLPGRLDGVYATIKQRAPQAEIVVLGYPRLVEPDGDCLSPSKRADLNRGADALHEVISARAAAAGVRYLDARAQFAGHGACGPAPWINPFSGSQIVESFHPNRDGYTKGYLALLNSR